MTGRRVRLPVGERSVWIYLPAAYEKDGARRFPVLYANDGDELERILRPEDAPASFLLAAVAPLDRNSEYTPWPAPPLARGAPPFAGGGAAYLRFLLTEVKPAVEAAFRTLPGRGNAGLAGYSLGGLLALYAAYQTGEFGLFCSLSGSLWYDGWVEFAAQSTPRRDDALIYLSLGRGEAESRNTRMARVAACTERTAALLGGRLQTPPVLQWSRGGHFTGIPARFGAAFRWFAAHTAGL